MAKSRRSKTKTDSIFSNRSQVLEKMWWGHVSFRPPLSPSARSFPTDVGKAEIVLPSHTRGWYTSLTRRETLSWANRGMPAPSTSLSTHVAASFVPLSLHKPNLSRPDPVILIDGTMGANKSCTSIKWKSCSFMGGWPMNYYNPKRVSMEVEDNHNQWPMVGL